MQFWICGTTLHTLQTIYGRACVIFELMKDSCCVGTQSTLVSRKSPLLSALAAREHHFSLPGLAQVSSVPGRTPPRF